MACPTTPGDRPKIRLWLRLGKTGQKVWRKMWPASYRLHTNWPVNFDLYLNA